MIKTIGIAADGWVCAKPNPPPACSLSRVLQFALNRGALSLARCNCIGVILLFLAVTPDHAAAATKGTVPPAREWQSTGEDTIFQVNDHEVLNPIKSGRWRLSGVLEVQFAGRIEPHENSVFQLFGPGVTALEGRFASVVLPKGWRYDLKYNNRAKTVALSNLRPDRAPAFPGAEGFGKYTIGGRGGRIIEVTNLADKGPGSFRAACEASGPRTVVFRVSGTIPLESELKIKNSFITIAGQTAPGDGICIKNYQIKFTANHVIMRYLRFRPGDERAKEQDGFGGQATTSSSIIARPVGAWMKPSPSTKAPTQPCNGAW